MTVSSDTLRSISTPDQFESRIGTLELIDGVPSGETVYEHLDFVPGRAAAERGPLPHIEPGEECTGYS
jgi:hypothetical protein